MNSSNTKFIKYCKSLLKQNWPFCFVYFLRYFCIL